MIPDGASDGRIVDPVWLLRAKIAPTGVTLDKTSLSLRKGATYTLTATVAPANATDKTVVWSSGNTSVATVDVTITGTPAGLKFRAIGLPAGLTLTEDGRLYGKVPQPGNYPITLTVTAPDGITENLAERLSDPGV